MNFLKDTILRLFHGLLYGFGFMLAIVFVGYFALPDWYTESSYESDDDTYSYLHKEYDETAKLDLDIREERIDEEEFILLGEIQNEGDTSWSMITLKAELFDIDGNFIDRCEEYIMDTSRPGEAINFKMSCGSQCSSFALKEYDHYKIEIESARAVGV